MVTIKVAETDSEKKEAHKVRHRVFCEEMGVLETDGEGLEKDEFDERSVQFIVKNGEEVVGTARFIPFAEGKEFLIEKSFPLPSSIKKEESAEISRMAVLKEHRNMSRIGIRLMDYVYEFCKRSGVKHILAFANFDTFSLYERLKIPRDFTAEPVEYNGWKTIPLVFSVQDDFKILRSAPGNA